MRNLLSVALVAMLATGGPCFGWGRDGHAIIAAVAESRLSPDALKQVRALLGGQSMASVASWADEVRNTAHPESYNWHFVDIPRARDSFRNTDCFLPDDTHPGASTDHHNCVVHRISMFEQSLAFGSDNPEDLKFLIHLVGDSHQPFHAMADNKGANGIAVVLFGNAQCGKKPCNLHSAWDDGLIEHTGRNQTAYVAFIIDLIKERNLDKEAIGTPADWSNAGHKLAQEAWLNQNDALDQPYFDNHIDVVNTQLALAAIRLADAIERSLGSANE